MDIDFKRLLTAMALCLLIMYGWMYFTGKFKPAPPGQTTPSATTPTRPSADTEPDRQPTVAVPTPGQWQLQQPPSQQQKEYILGGLEKQSNKYEYKARITIDSASAAVRQVLLSEHKLKVTDKKTGYPLLEPTQDDQGRVRHSLMLGHLKFTGRAETFDLSDNCWKPQQDSTDPLTGIRSVGFTAMIEDHENNPIMEITKTYRYGDNYVLDFSLDLANKSPQPLQIESLELLGPMGLIREDPRSDTRAFMAAYFDSQGKITVEREYMSTIETKPQKTMLKKPFGASLQWFAVTNKFFAAAVHPIKNNNLQEIEGKIFDMYEIESKLPTVDRIESKTPPKQNLAVQTTLAMEKPIAAQSNITFDFEVYLGAIDREIFENPQNANLNNLHYEKLMPNQSCAWCAFDWLTFLVLKLMKGTYMTVGNYGVAVIILVLLVRLVLHPITKKSQVSMMKMSKMGPKIEEIKKKYVGNKEEIQKQTMAIYKEQGATPIMGCLPMMLQMPIWIALYTAVNTNVALRHQGLLPAAWHWLNDLSAPDRLIPFSWFGVAEPVQIPLLSSLMGNFDAINLLPLLVCIAMFLQTKFSPQAKMAGASPQAAQQQKMMMYMMPAMMLVFFYNMSSGFNLYIMASTFAGLIEQRFIRKHLKKEDEKATVGTTTATAKISSRMGPKKKKPKPPIKYT